MRGAFLASVARWLALAGVFCSVGTSRGGRQEAHHGRTPFRAAHRSLALRVASCMPAHTHSTASVAGKHGTRSPPPTGPHPHRSVELALNTQTSAFNTKTDPLNLRDDARPPNHPDRALRHRNRSPVILVHGNRLGPPI